MSTIKQVAWMPRRNGKATILQQLSSKRNWDMLQIKGSCGQLQHQIMGSSLSSEAKAAYLSKLGEMQWDLLKALDKKWAADKEAFRKAVEAEVLDYTPNKDKKDEAQRDS